jgi:hypothetical protein
MLHRKGDKPRYRRSEVPTGMSEEKGTKLPYLIGQFKEGWNLIGQLKQGWNLIGQLEQEWILIGQLKQG